MAEKDVTLNKNNSGTLPVIPLRNLLLAPNTITPLLVGRELSIHAAETALISDKMIICVTQKYEALTDEDPKAKDLYRYGTICTILQTMKLPDGNMRLLVEGEKRVLIKKYRRNKKYLTANYIVQDKVLSEKELESEALLRSFRKAFKSYVNLNKSIPEEAMIPLSDAENADEFFYYALSNIQLDITKKQQLFELSDLFESISQLYRIVIEEIQILKLEYKIDGTVKSKLSKLQREYYLNEQLKAIHKELGITKEDKTELLEFKKKVEKVNLSDQAKKKAEGELERFAHMNSYSPEYSVTHTYLTWILDLPWDDPKLKEFDLNTVLDVGGNIGYFPKIELMAGARKIVTYEPVPPTYAILYANLYKESNCVTINAAIAEKAGEVIIYVPLDKEGASDIKSSKLR